MCMGKFLPFHVSRNGLLSSGLGAASRAPMGETLSPFQRVQNKNPPVGCGDKSDSNQTLKGLWDHKSCRTQLAGMSPY